MKWEKIKYIFEGKECYGKRPYIRHPFDDEYDEDILKPRTPCLVRYSHEKLKTHHGDDASLVENYINKLYYDPNTDSWFDADGNYRCNFESDDIEAYVLLKELDSVLSGEPEALWCWDFGSALANTAIPALEKWIKNGVSYDPSMSPKEWQNILIKILDMFKMCKSDLDGTSEDLEVKDLDVRKKNYEEHRQKRREGFQLIADYYLSLWD